MQDKLVKVAMGFIYGFLFCLLFGTIGLGINTHIERKQSTAETKAIAGDAISIYSNADTSYITVSTEEGIYLRHKFDEFNFRPGTTELPIKPGEYTVLNGEGTIYTYGSDTIFNIDAFSRTMKMKKIITIASLSLGFIVGFLIGAILDGEEKPRQKFICE